jgi:hypothetical protein
MGVSRGRWFTRVVATAFISYVILTMVGALVITVAGARSSGSMIPFAIVKFVAIVGAAIVAAAFSRGSEIAAGVLAGTVIGCLTIVPTVTVPHPLWTDGAEIVVSAALGVVGSFLRLLIEKRLYRVPAVRYPLGGLLVTYGIVASLAMAVAHLLFTSSVLGHASGAPEFPAPIYWAILFPGLLGVFSLILGLRVLRVPGEDILKTAPDRFVLYLRSFVDDELRMPGLESDRRTKRTGAEDASVVRSLFRGFEFLDFATRDDSFEGRLARWITDSIGPVVAIARPGESLPPRSGASRLFVSGPWEATVTDLLARCSAVFVSLGRSAGVSWELQEIRRLGAYDRCCVVIPPLPASEVAQRWHVLRELLTPADVLSPDQEMELPEHTRFVCLGENGQFQFSGDVDAGEAGYKRALGALLLPSRGPLQPGRLEPLVPGAVSDHAGLRHEREAPAIRGAVSEGRAEDRTGSLRNEERR